MRDLARLAAGLVALFVLLRNVAVAGAQPAMLAATVIAGLVVLVALTLWRDGLITGSAVALAAHYAAALGYGHVTIDLAAPLVGALVVAYLDLADLAASLPSDRRVDRALLVSSARHAGGVVAVGTTAAVAAYAIAAVPWPGSEVVRAIGALGIVGAVLTPVLLLRRAQ